MGPSQHAMHTELAWAGHAVCVHTSRHGLSMRITSMCCTEHAPELLLNPRVYGGGGMTDRPADLNTRACASSEFIPVSVFTCSMS